MANDAHDLPFPSDTPAVPRGHPWIAWCVILGVMGLVMWRHSQPDPHAKQVVANRLADAVGDWQARYFVGVAKTFEKQDQGQFAAALETSSGPIQQRLRNVAVLGEISGPDAADRKLKALEKTLTEQQATDDDRKTAASLRKLYADVLSSKPTLPSLAADDGTQLVDRLGWSGKLALHPPGGADEAAREELLSGAKRTFSLTLLSFIAFGAMALAGLVALVVIGVLLLTRPKSRSLLPSTARGGIYAETFAAWMALYIALSYGAAWLPIEGGQFLLTAAVMFVSLSALAWPVLRGIPWREVRNDIGLFVGQRPLLEVLLGPVAYLAAMPLLIAGVLMILVLLLIQRVVAGNPAGELGPEGLPSHPIVGWLLEADWWQRIQLLFLASVMAPLMEETMFRGVLYRHLRDATSRFGYVGSVLTSALAVSFIFAAIHPQGWIAIPALMALALAFTLAREWRGTLLPAMLAHGINNFLVTCVLLSIT